MVDIFYVSEIVTGSLICRRITLIIQKNLILSYFRLSVVSLLGVVGGVFLRRRVPRGGPPSSTGMQTTDYFY